MKILQHILSVVLLVFLTTFTTHAQISEECGTSATASQGPLASQGDGIYLTAHGTLKALVVFVRFPNDNASNGHWPSNGFPSFADDFIDPTTTTVNANNYVNITNYYKEMSLNQFKVIGDVVKIVAPYSSTDSRYNGLTGNAFRRKANQDVLEYIDNNTSINFSDYDNWTANNDYDHSHTPDGVVDMIFMIWRNTWFITPTNTWRGDASMGYGSGSLLVDNGNTTIKFGFPYYGSGGSGVTIHDNSSSTTLLNTAKHELGHWLLGVGHPYGSGAQNRISSILQWAEPQGLSASVPERERLGWITVPEITSDATNVELDDFISTGDARKYKVPGGGANEYYYITNNQDVSMYDDATHNTSDKGLIILHDLYSNSNTGSNRYLLSDGDWDWNDIGQVVNPYDPNGSSYIPLFEREDVNRNGNNFAREISASGFGYSWLYALYHPETMDTVVATHFRGTNLLGTYSVNTRPLLASNTNPKPKTWSGNGVPFAIKVKSKSGNKLYVDFRTNYDPYTLSENTTWDHQIFLDNSVTVQSGVTLTIKPNTTVYVADGKTINIYGELDADGVTFTAMDNNWNGLTFQSGSDGEIKNSTIEKVQSYGGAAIKVYTNNHFEIHDNIIQDLTGACSGIQLVNADNTYVYDNHIENTTYHGIYASNSNAKIFDNFIKGYSNAGIYSSAYSSVVLSAISSPNYTGENTIVGGKYGLQISGNSYLNAGSSSSFGSQNRIANQSGTGWAHIYSTSPYTVYAKYNYFTPYNGSGGVAPTTAGSGTGTLYTTPYLTSDPAASVGFKVMASNVVNSEEELLLEQAIEYRFSEEYEKAESILSSLILSSSSSEIIDHSLFEYGWLAQLSKSGEYVLELESLQSVFANTEYEPTASISLARVYYSQDYFDRALDLLDPVIEEFEGTEVAYQAIKLAIYVAADAGYSDKTEEYYTLLSSTKLKTANDTDIIVLIDYLETISSKKVDKYESLELDEMPTDIFINNYPNPFNPTTNIEFTLPEQSRVSLKVFDLLGREVADLVNEVKSAGEYSVNFDASELSSGVYIYQLQVGNQVYSKRMTLIK